MLTIQKTAWFVGFVLLASGCKKTDAELAAKERAEIQRAMEKSYALTPYRLLKLVLRSETSPNRPEELVELQKGVEKLIDTSAKEGNSVSGRAKEIYGMAVLFYKTRALLKKHDEDQFPLLLPMLTKEPAPAPWYDNETEHLAISAFWVLARAVDTSGRAPSFEYAHYELSRAQAKPSWPSELQLLSFLSRGLLFRASGYHYAADEELTKYIDLGNRARFDEFAILAGVSPVAGHPALLAAGYFARAWNRMGMGRDDPATADLEAGLEHLEQIEVDNELTQWAWAFVHYKRGRYGEAGKMLEKLAQSPYLDEKARTEILESAQALNKEGRAPGFFAKGRSGLLVARAFLARIGGPERILTILLGEERGRRVYAPVTAIIHFQDEIAGYSDPKKLTGQAAEKATELGTKGLEFLRDKVDGKAQQP